MDEKKFILDSNIWISYIITDSIDELVNAIIQNELEICGDRHLLDEISSVLSRPKFKRYLKLPISRFMEIIELAISMVETQPYYSQLPDPKDNFLIALSHSSRISKVVTGDKTLLTLRTYEGIEFISLADFKKSLSQK